jgi:hypothetical protein
MDRDTIVKVEIYKAILGVIQERNLFGIHIPSEKVTLAFDTLLDIIDEEGTNFEKAENVVRNAARRCIALADLLKARQLEQNAMSAKSTAEETYKMGNEDDDEDDEEEDDE